MPKRASKVVEACTTIALAVSQTESGAAHTVQLMMRNPEFRATAISEARQRTEAQMHTAHRSDASVAARDDVIDAERVLRAYAGQRL